MTHTERLSVIAAVCFGVSATYSTLHTHQLLADMAEDNAAMKAATAQLDGAAADLHRARQAIHELKAELAACRGVQGGQL